ncbi:MAG: hypothetical protein KGL56_07865 [Alphaproteobacteria bacterium]|nr:hypothetical protein [Alphaproteobacteria bacterium]
MALFATITKALVAKEKIRVPTEVLAKKRARRIFVRPWPGIACLCPITPPRTQNHGEGYPPLTSRKRLEKLKIRLRAPAELMFSI